MNASKMLAQNRAVKTNNMLNTATYPSTRMVGKPSTVGWKKHCPYASCPVGSAAPNTTRDLSTRMRARISCSAAAPSPVGFRFFLTQDSSSWTRSFRRKAATWGVMPCSATVNAASCCRKE